MQNSIRESVAVVPMRRRRWGISFLSLLLLALSGCAVYPFKRAPAPVKEPEIVQRLLSQREYARAGRELLRIAEEAGPEGRMDYRLRAAEAFLDGGDANTALAALTPIPPLPRGSTRALWRDLLWARAALLQDRTQEALAVLDTPLPGDLSKRLQLQFQQTRVYAYEAAGNPGGVVRERAKLDALLPTEADRAQNRRAIWAAVAALTAGELRALLPASPGDPGAGWLELALLAKNYAQDRSAFEQQLARWKQQHLGHPAGRDALEQLYGSQGVLIRGPWQVAVLLPFAGRFAEAALAVRDGVISAWYDDAEDATRPMLRFYDADPEDTANAYRRALAEGAEFVIGPLEKSGIQALLKGGALPAPILALNQLEALSGSQAANVPNLYQFGLLPEQEAEQVASKAWADGFSHCVALTPTGSWGERLLEAFRIRYRSLGGEILAHESYPTNSANYAAAVARLVGNAQQARAYPRESGGKRIFVFLGAFPQQARQIYPVLRSQTEMPIYTTSHSYALASDHGPVRGLEGVIFGDMPLVLQNVHGTEGVYSAVQQSWPTHSTTLLRLYALGLDAYRLIPQLARLKAERYARFSGATGSVGMDGAGRLWRELRWARYVNGQAQALF